MIHKLFFATLFSLILVSCQGEPTETPTRGSVEVSVSESVQPLLTAQKQKFEELYPEARVSLQFMTSREAIARLFNDSALMIVTSRPLNAEEEDAKKRFNIEMTELKIAIDGIAIIVNVENPVSQMTMAGLDSVLSGTTERWNEVGWKESPGPINVFIPPINSSTYEVVARRVLGNHAYPKKAKTIEGSAGMIREVIKNKHAIGLVGINWYNQEKEKVKALELLDPQIPESLGVKGKYFGPYQAYIYQEVYPIRREVYIYSRADNFGVAAGFTSFITSSAGQKIVVANGLVPATMPVRIVEMTNRSLN